MAAPPSIGRRSFVKLVAGTAVAGYSVASHSWVASAGRPPDSPLARLPPLDGELVLDDASLAAAGQDFGQLVFERPVAVLRPGSVDDIARMLRFARRHDIRVVGRGVGHTTFGQSQHAAAIAFDLTTLDSDSIGPVGPFSAVRLGVDDWAAHYGEQWDRLRAAKRRYDRDDVLAGGPDVLGGVT